MGSFARWLRHHSEEALMAAAKEELARRYLAREGPAGHGAEEGVFWRQVFVPAYRRLPWGLRRSVLHRMPGSHRQRWQWRGGS